MATSTAPVEQTLFVRKASGLVKGWSSVDGFRYAFFSVNLFLGIYGFSYAAYVPGGSMFWSIIITTVLVMFGVLVYAGLISAMPRAGGDYVWQTRVFNSPTGFILAATGWWFILWQWIPIYAALTVYSFVNPVARIIGWNGLADWLATKNGIFVSALVVIVAASLLVAIGMKAYAKFQVWALIVGMIGFVALLIILAVTSKHGFQSAFNREYLKLYGSKLSGADPYSGLIANKTAAGQPTSVFAGSFWQSMRLVPFMCFWLLWPNWGATLYGEVRGAKDFRKNVYAMGGGLLAACILGLLFIGLIAKTMGYNFFMASQAVQGIYPTQGDYLSPAAMAAWIINVPAVQVILIIMVSLIVFGWWGTVFLSSTRVIFASAFDRILPEKAAAVTSGGVPWVALLLMAIPSVIVSALYAYTSWFATLTYDATLVIAVTFLGSGLAFMIMPWRTKSIWSATALPKGKIAGIPWMSIVAFIYSAFLVFNLVLWFKDATYGVNNWKSLVFMGCLYVLAAVIWSVAAIVRRRQGMPLEAVAREIPVE
jgi:APA family basic amino acid/polyamine antiporter